LGTGVKVVSRGVRIRFESMRRAPGALLIFMQAAKPTVEPWV